MLERKPPKPRPCKVCKTPYTPQKMGQKVCSIDCGLSFGREVNRKNAEKLAKAERIADKARREALKSRSEWIQDTQKEFNRYIRLRGHSLGHTCISCQKPRHEIEGAQGWKPGGCWDAGHFVSVGSNETLRFTDDNCWLQCKSCNAGEGKYARKSQTVKVAYEANLRTLIGDERVDALLGPHPLAKWTIPELKEMRNTYRARANELAKVDPTDIAIINQQGTIQP
jgi:Bacteriophage Lambda NinG protein